MYFAVLVAFSLVFLPLERPAWRVISYPPAVIAVVVGQAVAIGAWAFWGTRQVLKRLDADPDRPGVAQRRHARNLAHLGRFSLAGLLLSMWGTDWPHLVRDVWQLGVVWGLDELVLLLPFFAAVILAWALMYPADQAMRQLLMQPCLEAGLPVRRPWSFGAYLLFRVRDQLLVIALPMLLIVVANDVVQQHARSLRRVTRLVWADQLVLVAVAGVILFFAPVLLRRIWSTSALPAGSLRERLLAMAARCRMRCRDILVWHSEGMVVNALVMGVVPQVRYVLLSDGLIENMDDEQIEAVFGHEIGHVRHHHIPFYALFSIVSMFAVGGACELAYRVFRVDEAYLTPIAVALVAAIWGLGFGWISRRFEKQADLFGARAVSPEADACDLPCAVHHAPGPVSPEALCAVGAAVFAESLRRVSFLNNIPEEDKSWRHSSIADRVRHVIALAREPAAVRRFDRLILGIKLFLLVGTLVGCAVAAWLYWPGRR